jgi:hypothetical protein
MRKSQKIIVTLMNAVFKGSLGVVPVGDAPSLTIATNKKGKD